MLTERRAREQRPAEGTAGLGLSPTLTLRERRPVGGMTGSPTLLKVLFLSLLCFVFVKQVRLGLDKFQAGIFDRADTGFP